MVHVLCELRDKHQSKVPQLLQTCGPKVVGNARQVDVLDGGAVRNFDQHRVLFQSAADGHSTFGTLLGVGLAKTDEDLFAAQLKIVLQRIVELKALRGHIDESLKLRQICQIGPKRFFRAPYRLELEDHG